jgi:hypothetical protein
LFGEFCSEALVQWKDFKNSALLPALKFSRSGTTPMPSGRMRISSSSVPGRRVGLTIPITPRHNVNPIGMPSLTRIFDRCH